MARKTFGDARESSVPLIGRRLELAWLRSRSALAADGYAHLVLVEGDVGIGKTRLVDAFLAQARDDGVTVVRGRCYEHLDLAYLPLREALFAPLAAELGDRPGREADAALLRRVGAVDAGRLPDPTEGEAGDREHTRQLLALTRLVLESAGSRRTVLSIDDLDFADAATVDLLRHLLFRVADVDAPLLVIATSRGDAGARAGAAIGRLRGEPRVATILLHALSAMEATELARQLDAGQPVEDARRLAEAGNGNPMLIEALVHQARRGASDPLRLTPVTNATSHPITDAVAARLDSLGPDARAVSTIAALMQPNCPNRVLGRVAALDLVDLDAAIDDAVRAGVLTDDDEDGGVGFTHPLFAHSLVEHMTASNRRELHARIAAVLLDDVGEEPTEIRALAHHLIGAGDRAEPGITAEVTRRAGDEAIALTAWREAARFYEAAIAQAPEPEPADLAALHRCAGLARRGDMEMREAVRHFDAAIDRLGPDADPVVLADLHIWRLRCAVGSQEMLDVVGDRDRLERLVAVIEPDHPELAAEGLVELAQSRWVAWDMAGSAEAARRAMALADACGSHRAFVRATTTLSVPQWAEYDIRGSLETLEAGIAHARAGDDDALLVGGPLFRAPLVLAWLGRFDEAEALAHEGCAAAERMHYPLEQGLPLAALTQMAVACGRYDDAEQHAHQALLVQRLSGYHWAAGLFLPALASGHLARGRYDAARDALDTWAETGDPLEQQAIALFRRLVTARERGQTVEGEPLPRLPRDPVIGLDAWAAACVDLARWEGSRADVGRARDLLAAVDARGGVLTSSLVTLVPRALGVAHGLVGDDAAAVATLRRALDVANRLGAEAEGARTRVDLATVLARMGDRQEALGLLDEAIPVLDRLGMTPDAEVAASLTGRATARAPANRSATPVNAVIFFSDVVDSTRLTEELGAVGYRARARLVEDLVTSAIVANGGSVVTGISLGDGFIGLFNAVDQAVATALHCAREVGRTGLHLHLALHRGEILLDGDRIYGGPVNYSARICGLSGPDEILVSEELRAAIATDAPVAVVDRGQHGLKGFEGLQTVYALLDFAPGSLPVG